VTGLSYLADAAGVFSSIAVLRSIRGRLNNPAKPLVRGLVAAAAGLIGCLAYFLVGFALWLALPAHPADTLIELQQGFGLGSRIIMAATIAATFHYYRLRKETRPIKPPEGGVRERLLRARADIQQRIEDLRASPVLNYRGGIPQPDLIIEGLNDRLAEIDDALSKLGPSE
jgi:hypothetical protein